MSRVSLAPTALKPMDVPRGMRPLELLAAWLDTEPEVPDDEWDKRFSGMTVCGEGELVKTFLLPGQAAKGKRVP
jgi:hypothetical protein